METAEWAITNWWGQVRVLKLSLHTAPQDITEAILKSHVADHLMTGFQNNRRKMTFWRMEDTFNNLVSLLDATLEHRIAIMHDNIGVRQRPYAKVSVYRGETIIATYRVVEISHTEGHAQRTIALVQAYRNWQRWNDEINGPGGRYASHVDDERYEYHTVLENGEQLNVSMSLSRDQYDTPIQLLPELFIMKSTVPA